MYPPGIPADTPAPVSGQKMPSLDKKMPSWTRRTVTACISEWWPLATHSVGKDQATGVVFGEGVGGAITESLADGTTSVWGTVTRWEPPYLLACTWHAGTPVTEASAVEVTFTPAGPGETVVQLVHSGWEQLPRSARTRADYDRGWDVVIGSYVRQAALSGLPG